MGNEKPSLSSNANGLYLGTAGWNYNDWRGCFYPRTPSRGFSELAYLSRYVTAAEVNTSFYRIPALHQADRWVAAVSDRPRFVFAMKLWQGFTHDPSPVAPGDVHAFSLVAERLAQSGRLAGVLAQFPWSFKYGEDEIARLRRLAREFGRWRLIVEVRHASWLRDETLDLLKELDCSFCNIDQPVIGQSAPPTALVTASPAYVRLHGRRYDVWFAEGEAPSERYNYLYKTEEIAEWAERIRQLTPKAEQTLAIANNHFNAKAVATILELQHLLTGEKPAAPPELLEAFPHLRDICRLDPSAPPSGRQLELF